MRFRRLVLNVVVALAACALACTPFHDDSPGAISDLAVVPPGGDASSCDLNMDFGTPTLVPGLSTGMSIAGLRLSPDYRVAYFRAAGRSDTVGGVDLYTATRETRNLPFDHVAPIAGSAINTPYDEFDPTVSGDGLTLLFARSQGAGAPVHIYSATRSSGSDPFTNVMYVSDLNDQSALLDASPFLREDGQVVYFDSTRIPANSTDIFRAEWNARDASVRVPRPVDPIDQPTTSEIAPVVTPDDNTIYFASDRTDGKAQGDYDIWTATRRIDGAWGAPTNVAELNSLDYDVPTFVTRDGCTLYFSSNRSGYLVPYVASRGLARRSDAQE